MFGFTPLDTLELDLPAVGLKGIACVLPEAVPAGRRHGHRVHVKGMLLSEQAEEILPDWAFFVRCVVDAESLRHGLPRGPGPRTTPWPRCATRWRSGCARGSPGSPPATRSCCTASSRRTTCR
ncbi:hypothetical protein SALBM217S_04372 [Streptomyces griseoloalbus]